MSDQLTLKEYWNQIENREDIRGALIGIRAILREAGKEKPGKEKAGRNKTGYDKVGNDTGLIDPDGTYLPALLENEDAKIRKNAALLMGSIIRTGYDRALFEGYKKEEQLFVRSAYLTSLASYDISFCRDELEERYHMLLENDQTEENRKHAAEELKALSALLIDEREIAGHTFRGFKTPVDVILVTAKGCAQQTKAQTDELCPEALSRAFAGGVVIKTKDLHFLDQVRTAREVLIRIPGKDRVPYDPYKAADTLGKSELGRILAESHRGNGSFAFRTELRGKSDERRRVDFVKKFSTELEKKSKGVLVGRTAGYEVTIRLSEHKGDDLLCFVKLHTIPDDRFTYRKKYISESMKPVNAAGAVLIAKEYMKEDAGILDPFCGVGTMLIERQKMVRANTMYGIDYKAEAIAGAKVNTEAAGEIIHYTQKNFFDFTHEYLFDEIITDMPFALGEKNKEEIRETYRLFFPKAEQMLTTDGIIILYTRDMGFVRNYAPTGGFEIVKEVPYSAKDSSTVCVLKRR